MEQDALPCARPWENRAVRNTSESFTSVWPRALISVDGIAHAISMFTDRTGAARIGLSLLCKFYGVTFRFQSIISSSMSPLVSVRISFSLYLFCGLFLSLTLPNWRQDRIRTTNIMKSIFFWDMTPCSALSGTRRIGGTYRLHLQACHLLARCFAELFYNPEDGGDTFLRNVGYHSTHYTASYPRRRYSSFLLAQLIFSTLEAICSSETSGDTHRTTRRYIPDASTILNNRCENLKSYKTVYT
jgi:hypothetical protein